MSLIGKTLKNNFSERLEFQQYMILTLLRNITEYFGERLESILMEIKLEINLKHYLLVF